MASKRALRKLYQSTINAEIRFVSVAVNSISLELSDTNIYII